MQTFSLEQGNKKLLILRDLKEKCSGRRYMLNRMITIDELLKAKEGEQYQFKEAKSRFDSGEAARCCCALANCGGGKL